MEDTAGCASIRSEEARGAVLRRRIQRFCDRRGVGIGLWFTITVTRRAPELGKKGRKDPLPEGFSSLAVLRVRIQLRGDFLNPPWSLHPAAGSPPSSEPPHISLDSDAGWLSALFLDEWRLSDSCSPLQSVMSTVLEGSPRVCGEDRADRPRICWERRLHASPPVRAPLPWFRAAQARGAFRLGCAVLLSHLQTEPSLFVSSAVLLEFPLTVSQRPHVF